MFTVAVSCVKNESDIVEAFVRHTTALVSQLVVLDNGSTDGTLDILRALERDGLPLVIVEDPSPGKWHAQRMTRLMRDHAVRQFAADWVVPLDADEFLSTAPGQPLFPSSLPTDRPCHLVWKTYVPDARDDASEVNVVGRIRHRLAREARTWSKVVVPGRLARHPDASLAQGNHYFCIHGKVIENLDVDHAHLAHFPGRSAGQLMAKVAIAHFQYSAMRRRTAGWGDHYSLPFEMIKHDPAAFAASFRDLVVRYTLQPDDAFTPIMVHDPVRYAGEALRYTPSATAQPSGLRAIFDYVDELARHLARTEARLAQFEAIGDQDIDSQENVLAYRRAA